MRTTSRPRTTTKSPAPKQDPRISLTFTSDELIELAHHLAAGDVLLQTKTRLLNRIMEALARSGHINTR